MGKIPQLTNEQLDGLKQKTPYDEKDITRVLKRYSLYDKTKAGTEGITYDEMLKFPEFRLNPFMPRVLDLYVEGAEKKIFPEKFVFMTAALDSKMDTEHKRKLAFKCLDVHDQGRLQHNEIFQLYKLLFSNALSNDQLLDLTFRALEHPDLDNPGQIQFQDFTQLVSDPEIRHKFTVNLQLK